jgi:hypothetical protein
LFTFVALWLCVRTGCLCFNDLRSCRPGICARKQDFDKWQWEPDRIVNYQSPIINSRCRDAGKIILHPSSIINPKALQTSHLLPPAASRLSPITFRLPFPRLGPTIRLWIRRLVYPARRGKSDGGCSVPAIGKARIVPESQYAGPRNNT